MNMIQAPAPQGNAQSMNRYAPAIRESFQNIFGGLNHTDSCGDGEIYDMENICLRDYPVLKPRKHRILGGIWQRQRMWPVGPEEEYYPGDATDLINGDRLWTIEKVRAVRDGVLIDTESFAIHDSARDNLGSIDPDFGNNTNLATITWHHTETALKSWEERRRERDIDWAVCGKYIFVNNGVVVRNDVAGYFASTAEAKSRLGDLKRGTVVAVPRGQSGMNVNNPEAEEVWYDYYVWEEDWRPLNRNAKPQQRFQMVQVSFVDGTYKEASAKLNTMKADSGTFSKQFQVGDTVTIYGAAKAHNNGTHTIREISADGKSLRFYEDEFEAEAGVYVRIELVPPDMDWVCASNNRVFGCKGDSIFASALGDPYNWWTYDGLSTDAFSVDVGSPGDFTGCCEYNGDVYFFKEDVVYRLYLNGSNPARWQLIEYHYPGVMEGSRRSLVKAGGVLYWFSKNGMMRFTGGYPQSIQEPVGSLLPDRAVCGSDTVRIYCCFSFPDEGSLLYAYDTRTGLWAKHDAIDIKAFSTHGRGFYGVAGDGSGPYLVHQLDHNEYYNEGSGAYDGEDTQLIEFGDMQLQTADHKLQERITVTAQVDMDSLLEVWYSYDGRGWGKAGEMKPGPKRAQTFSWPPHRNDFCRIRLKGKGNWKLWNVTTGKQVGTELG